MRLSFLIFLIVFTGCSIHQYIGNIKYVRVGKYNRSVNRVQENSSNTNNILTSLPKKEQSEIGFEKKIDLKDQSFVQESIQSPIFRNTTHLRPFKLLPNKVRYTFQKEVKKNMNQKELLDWALALLSIVGFTAAVALFILGVFFMVAGSEILIGILFIIASVGIAIPLIVALHRRLYRQDGSKDNSRDNHVAKKTKRRAVGVTIFSILNYILITIYLFVIITDVFLKAWPIILLLLLLFVFVTWIIIKSVKADNSHLSRNAIWYSLALFLLLLGCLVLLPVFL